jgi:hypothetical protein
MANGTDLGNRSISREPGPCKLYLEVESDLVDEVPLEFVGIQKVDVAV